MYIIAFDVNSEDFLYSINYWLSTIRTKFTGKKLPPIVLVGTQIDRANSVLIAQVEKSITSFLERNRQLCGVHYVSNVKGTGIKTLKKALKSIASDSTYKLTTQLVPAYYQVLANKIASKRNSCKPFMSWAEYEVLVKKVIHSVGGNVNSIMLATDFLHSSGVIMYFRDHYKLKNTVFLDPKWLSDRLSDLINFRFNWRHGRIPLSAIRQIWESFDDDKIEQIISVLESFDIFHRMYNTQNEPEILVPSLLPVEPSLKIEFRPKYFRTYTFPFLPLGFFGNLVSRLHQDQELNVEEARRNRKNKLS